MNTERFDGTPDELNARLQALLAGAATTIDQVFQASNKAKYIIIWS